MRKKQSTLAILLFLLVSCIILSGVWYVYFSYNQDNNLLCGDELKKCPDGSFVELGGPLCSYPKCPEQTKPAVLENQNPAANQSPVSADIVAPQEVVSSFYSWYQNIKPAQQKQKNLFESRLDLTNDFKAQLGSAGSGFDHLLCAVGKSDSFNTSSIFANGNRAEVLASVNGTTGARDVLVELINDNSSWQINEVFCQTVAADTALTGAPAQPADNMPGTLKVQ